jgi:ABC-type multidrug transport system fused ATPase/permease subunit
VLVLAFILSNFLRAAVFYELTLTSANNMHRKMLEKIARSPVLFFDSNPAGRIMTRLSKDMSILDMSLPTFLVFAVAGLGRSVSVFITVCFLQPWLTIIITVAASLMYCYFCYTSKTMV